MGSDPRVTSNDPTNTCGRISAPIPFSFLKWRDDQLPSYPSPNLKLKLEGGVGGSGQRTKHPFQCSSGPVEG